MGETPRARSAIGKVEPMQRIRREKLFSPCKLGETPIVQALRGTIGQVEPMQRCGISALKAQKLCAQQGALSLKREPSEAVSESQNLKRESKSLILSLELTQRADFVTRAYTALSRLNVHYSSIGWSCLPCRARSTVSGSFVKSATRDAGFFMGLSCPKGTK